MLIDDSPVNLAQAREQGITAATISHPWNRDARDVIRAEDWAGLAHELRGVLA